MQWDKLHKSAKYPHLSRWYEYVSSNPTLQAVDDEYLAARRRKPIADFQKDLAAAGRGGGGGGLSLSRSLSLSVSLSSSVCVALSVIPSLSLYQTLPVPTLAGISL